MVLGMYQKQSNLTDRDLCYILQTSRYYGSNERSLSWLGCTICLSQDLYDGGRRYGIMTTSMSEVFNSVLKGAYRLPFTTLVQLTFSSLTITLLQEGNKVLIDWHLMSSSLYMLMLRFRVVLLRLVQWKLFFMITYRADFMSSQGVVERSASTYMTKNAHVERHDLWISM